MNSHHKRRIRMLCGLVTIWGASLLGGCAASKYVDIDSEPRGATFTIEQVPGMKAAGAPITGTTPARGIKLAFTSNSSYRVTFKLDRHDEAARLIAMDPPAPANMPEKVHAVLSRTKNFMVKANPEDSTITIRTPDNQVIATGPSPLPAVLDFDASHPLYVVEVRPSDKQFDTVVSTTQEITEQAFSELNPDGTGLRTKEVNLPEKLYRDIARLEVVVDNKNRWRGLVGVSRAFNDTTDEAARNLTRIYPFAENTAVQSMSLDDKGDFLVFSLATLERNPGDVSPSAKLPHADRIMGLKSCNIHRTATTGGTALTEVTSGYQLDMSPIYSLSSESVGEHILFSSNRRRPESADLLRINAKAVGGITDIHTHREARLLSPSQAKNGVIAFALHPIDPTQRPQVWTMSEAGQFPTQVTEGTQPSISPDGRFIAYIDNEGNLSYIGIDGTGRTRLTDDAARIREDFRNSLTDSERAMYDYFKDNGVEPVLPYSNPSWSPDERHLLYTGMLRPDRYGRPNEDIYIIGLEGAARHEQVTSNGSSDRFPVMSPDRKYIYFMSNRGRSWSIWRVDNPQSGS